MTTFTDETLMAYADDELDPTLSAAVAAAMREDPDIERRVARHRALRSRVRLAYSAELQELPPERLAAAARGQRVKAPATVTDLATARAGRSRRAAKRPAWRPFAALAASLLLGLALGYFAVPRTDAVIARSGGWVAGGVLAAALSTQLSGQAAGAPVEMGLSFRSKAGDYCRVFNLKGAAAAAGIACRQPDAWQIRVLAQDTTPLAAAPGAPDAYRTAASSMPSVVLDAVQGQIIGEPLDRDAEMKARGQGWQPRR